MTIGFLKEFIASEISTQKINQHRLAKRSGVCSGNLSRMLKDPNRNSISLLTAIKLIQGLGYELKIEKRKDDGVPGSVFEPWRENSENSHKLL